MLVTRFDIVLASVIRDIEIVGFCGELTGQRIYLLYRRENFQFFTECPYLIGLLFLDDGDLAVRKSCAFSEKKSVAIEPTFPEFLLDFDDALHLVEKPEVYLGHIMESARRCPLPKRFRERKNPPRRRFTNFPFVRSDTKIAVLVRGKAVCSNIEHAYCFL